MRRIDKKINLQKANILAEQRYLTSKGIIIENREKPEIIWRAPSKDTGGGEIVKFGDRGEYLGREGGEEVVSFGGRNFYTSEGTFEYVDKKVDGNETDLINHINNWGGGLKEEPLYELNTDTYSKLMNNTSEFPTQQFQDPEAGERKNIGTQNQRINTLSRGGFEKSFYSDYPKGQVSIETGGGQYVFSGLYFRANHSMYALIFTNSETGRSILIKKDASAQDGYYIDERGLSLYPESKELVNQMLRYSN